jgi:Fur family peroxide stress response transcriptional regulator
VRNSKQKEIVLRALDVYRVHPTAEELYKYIHQEYSDIGVATVYRNLNKLAEKGIIRKIIGLDGSSHFDSCIEPHFHFICSCCGKIYDVPDNVGTDLIAKAEEFTDCKITSMDITFRGFCRNCAEKHDSMNNFKEEEMKFVACIT